MSLHLYVHFAVYEAVYLIESFSHLNEVGYFSAVWIFHEGLGVKFFYYKLGLEF